MPARQGILAFSGTNFPSLIPYNVRTNPLEKALTKPVGRFKNSLQAKHLDAIAIDGGLPASDIISGSIVSLMNPETPDPADINASPAASACFLLFGSGFALSSTHDPRSFLPTWRV
jgi:hypothetical protein